MLKKQKIYFSLISFSCLLFFSFAGQSVVQANEKRFTPTIEVSYYMSEANLALESKDYQKSIYFLEKASKFGYPEAQMNLGLLYKNGLGVLKDDNQAIYWLKLSADKHFPRGCYELALMYKEKEELMEANFWFNKAYQYGDIELRKLVDLNT